MNNRIIIFGASGHAKSIAEILELLNYEIIGFIDSFLPQGSKVLKYKTLGNESILTNMKGNFGTHQMVLGIGDIHDRKMIHDKLKLMNPMIEYPSIISPLANVSKYTSIGIGTVIHHHTFVNLECVIGDFCVIGSSSNIEHNTQIGNFCNLSPMSNIGPRVSIEEKVFIGASSTILQNKKIEENSVIGAGSLVINDIPKNSLALGVPAKIKIENYKNKNILK